MFGRGRENEPGRGQVEEPVAVSLELAITGVATAVEAFLAGPSSEARAALVTALGVLDAQTATADAYAGFGRKSAYTKSRALGSTRDADPLAEVPVNHFDAQVALVRAAKAQVADPSPANLAALGAAAGALRSLGDP